MITVDDLMAALGIPLASALDQAWAQTTVDAVNAYVDGLPHVTAGAWTDSEKTGGTLLAVEVYNSRSTATGGAASLDITGALIEQKVNRNINRWLGLGRYAKPRVG